MLSLQLQQPTPKYFVQINLVLNNNFSIPDSHTNAMVVQWAFTLHIPLRILAQLPVDS